MILIWTKTKGFLWKSASESDDLSDAQIFMVVAQRQKHNGMSWLSSSSGALA